VLQGFETIKVTLEGFLLGAMFERKVQQGDGKDNDFHLEISDSQNWKSRHVIVEVPPGPEYCDARKQIFDIVHQDGCGSDKCTLRTPVKIRVTGFIFLDAAHGKTCKIKRGIVNQRKWRRRELVAVQITGGITTRCKAGGWWCVPKKELVRTLSILLESQRLKIANGLDSAPSLIRELRGFRHEFTTSGRFEVGCEEW
jgi:hypothetical protein